MFPKAIEFLLDEAGPSIQYRTRLEIMGEPPCSDTLAELHRQILDDPRVVDFFSRQQADGWITDSFHGYDSMEAAIRLLHELGVAQSHPPFARALACLQKEQDRVQLSLGRVGKTLDLLGLGGARTIQAATLAHAGLEGCAEVRDQLGHSLEAFAAVLNFNSAAEIATTYRGRQVFRQGVIWPSIYDLRLLAYTTSWRTPQKLQMIAQSINRLVDLSPLPQFAAKSGSQIMATASFCMTDFNLHIDTLREAGWMMWFHQTELLARLGVVGQLPAITRQVEALHARLDTSEGLFLTTLNHAYFKRWGSYSGLMLEQDWGKPCRRMADLTFRSLLILRYAAAPAAA